MSKQQKASQRRSGSGRPPKQLNSKTPILSRRPPRQPGR